MLNFKRVVLAFIGLALVLAIVAGTYGHRYYNRMNSPNIYIPEAEHAFIHIPTGATYRDALDTIFGSQSVIDTVAFKWAASRMGYPHSIRAGRYRLASGQTNRELVGILRAGLQTPTRVTFISFRTPSQLAKRVANQIEADSLEIIQAFSNQKLIDSLGFTLETFMGMFVPNTYEFFWNTNALGFFARMKREQEAFWSQRRDSLAKEIGLSRMEVITLASIVEEETNRTDERPRVAGVYLNRIKRGMPLQADPTVKFAVGDFTIRRVLTRHLQVDSPYNTYRNRGIPPGPICAPSISSIDAVLNSEQHSYLYFCARPDYSGYHAFARTLSEHNRNARIYQQWLNKQRIFR
jgi:UPF0755 protein